MPGLLSHHAQRNTVLLFGSQALALDEAFAYQLRSILLSTPRLSWAVEAIRNLPRFWGQLCTKIPSLQNIPGKKLLEDLEGWIETGRLSEASFSLPNILLTPLVVITHLSQYVLFLGRNEPGATKGEKLHSHFRDSAETLGLCTGLLSAAAVSCSADSEQLQHYGAVAVHLAMAIGALIDAEDTSNDPSGRSKSLSVAWTNPKLGIRITEILQSFPQAYISVLLDRDRVTVTSPKTIAPQLQQQLKAAGAAVAEVNLRGSFHNLCHRTELERLIDFCDSHSLFQFLDASELAFPIRSNTDGQYVKSRKLHHIVLQSMLIEQSNWHRAFTTLETSSLANEDSLVISFGPERCVPHAIARQLGSRLIQVMNFDVAAPQLPMNALDFEHDFRRRKDPLDNAIAVVGMSCHVPGASDLEGFWDLLRTGESQHVEVPKSRFNFETAWRDVDPKRRWFGNFLQDHDTFDHRFFKKSPREMESTDPQHRLMLQVAYQAVEQSGYFNLSSPVSAEGNECVGCFVGIGTVDYENNIAGYPANAYSATGNLRAFAAGKISHYFGWTGPGITVDTACSSSAVAIHLACKAILGGECHSALAGGVNVMTSPEWFQNLAGASFLSPTGQCKPFDVNADGYCRGEGIGAVFLKKLSSALADGDQIFGVIRGSAVTQNQNCTPITVPNAGSLANLFTHATHQAGLEPHQISVVEAHGTGTPVGDPAEYDGVRKVFGGHIRSSSPALSLGSVKGLLGHTEYASGVIALLKTLLMIHERAIPPQPSFQTINPSIEASPSDRIEIATSVKKWEAPFRAALINNYGASGSNATLVVTQAPEHESRSGYRAEFRSSGLKYPFFLCGHDESALQRYCAAFARFVKSHGDQEKRTSIANLAFQVSRQSNRKLSHALIFTCSSTHELEEKLSDFPLKCKPLVTTRKPSRPVVLCFGGQISTFIGLDRQVYERVSILRRCLDRCDAVCLSLGLDSFYPSIFGRDPLTDVVRLQTMLFSIQYSCAMSWKDCGVHIAAVVGHSFGELTALCISGILSLVDALRTVVGRARIIRDSWGPDKGAMVAVEADLEDVKRLLDLSNRASQEDEGATIACFNGPRSFTLAGSTDAIENVVQVATTDPAFSSLKCKKLKVTNAFHSGLVDPLLGDLEQLGHEVTFQEPLVPFERATETKSAGPLTPHFLADHMRSPVYFHHAVQRLSQQYPSCIFLEAGSNSTITIMASRALGSPPSSHFQPVNITSENSFQSLIDSTANLWREGLNVSFWPHHFLQSSEYTPLFLPPYQFERSKHWMTLKKSSRTDVEALGQSNGNELPGRLWTFSGYQNKEERSVRFQINTSSPKFLTHVSDHKVAQTMSTCPSMLQLEIAIDALMSLCPPLTDSRWQPQFQEIVAHAPMTVDSSTLAWVDAETNDKGSMIWDWRVVSINEQDKSAENLHISGRFVFRPVADLHLDGEFATYERLINKQLCLHLLNGHDADEVMQGRNIYKTYADVVEYGQTYRGVQKIVGKDNESAGRVAKASDGEDWLDASLADCFCQVASIFLNTMIEKADTEMYILVAIHQWIRAPQLTFATSRPETWDCYARHSHLTDSEYISDIFVFDHQSGALQEVILGLRFQKISKFDLKTASSGIKKDPKISEPLMHSLASQPESSKDVEDPKSLPNAHAKERSSEQSQGPDISAAIKDLLSKISGLEPHEISNDADLVDIGVDSLMGMELAREIEFSFKCTLDPSELIELTNFHSLVVCVKKTLGLLDAGNGAYGTSDKSEEEETQKNAPQINGAVSQVNGIATHPNGVSSQVNGDLPSSPIATSSLLPSAILDAFRESKEATDDFITKHKLANYVHSILPKSTELCVAYIVEAFEKLGCSLHSAKPGQTLTRIQHIPQHEQFVTWIYNLLEKHARLIDIDGSEIRRTAIPPPNKPAETLLQDLIHNFPAHASDHLLTQLTSVKLAECLTGQADGLQLVFGSTEGKDIASAMYSQSPINLVWIKQIEYFLGRVLSRHSKQASPVEILEMGAGTGGTTAKMIPLLSSLGVPIEYTVTDISSSLVAAARKRFKQYPFMRFKVLDIEKNPPTDLLHSQHIILATNCVHATHSLANSTRNIHKILRSDGFLMMLEMTEPLPWVDIVFGLLEGWWLFDDGRQHALAPATVWEKTLHDVGYGHVDWTEGTCPEASIQRLIIAMADCPRYDRAATIPKPPQNLIADSVNRQIAVDTYLHTYGQSIPMPKPSEEICGAGPLSQCVVITGATGSLGSHIVAYYAERQDVSMVVCLNRYSSKEATMRQNEALTSRGIELGAAALSKLKVFEVDTSKPTLGLSSSEYKFVVDNVTQIVNNAWPMSITRPVGAFEPQFKTMRNLVELAHESSCKRPRGSKIGFQLVSSIAAVGNYPLYSGKATVPEEGMTIDSVPATGYAEAKLVCERILDNTLGLYPERFRKMVVRIGQIAGSKASGYWNPVEHPAFIVRSSQTLKALPDLKGDLSWCPVDDVAAIAGDLLCSDTTPHPIYHIENPSRQSWHEVLLVIAGELGIPHSNIIPFDEWTYRVRQFPGPIDPDNPAGRISDFLDTHFVRMACGGLVFGMDHSKEHSPTLRGLKPLDDALIRRYVQCWKEAGVLRK